MQRAYVGIPVWAFVALATITLSACGGRGASDASFVAATPAGPPTPIPEPVEVADETTAEQLATFRFLWNQINQSYAYDDFNGVDWNSIRGIYRKQVEDGMTDVMFQAAMRGMISELGDPGTFYLTPQEIAERQAELDEDSGDSDMGYVGTLVGMPDGTREQMTILYVYPGSPAEEAGLRSHDVIIGIEGEPVPAEPEANILEQVRGEIGTAVQLTVESPDGDRRELTVMRAPLAQSGQIEVEVLDGDIGYIFLPPGDEEAALGVQVTDAVRELRQDEDIQALILDLRIARTGTEWPIDGLLGLFMHGEAYEVYNITESLIISVTGVDVAGSQELPLVVLVGYDTVGASETFAGALQAMERATIVGGQTPGDTEIVYNFPLGEDQENPEGLLALTALTTGSPDGEGWGRVGVTPDVEVDRRWEDFTAEFDAQLQAAINTAATLTG